VHHQRQILIRQLGSELIGVRSDRPEQVPVRVGLPSATSGLTSAAVREVLGKLDAGRLPRVAVFTSNSTAIVNLNRVDLAAHQAVPAAILAAEESYAGAPGELQVAASVQASWQKDRLQQSTVLTVSEKNTVLESIAESVQSAGGRLVGVIPQRAAVAASLHTRAMRSIASGDAANQIMLHIGEDISAIAVIREGRVASLRTMSYGYGLMIDAIVSAAQRVSPDAHMDRGLARELFSHTGIPRPDEVVDERTGLTGRHILPLFQPVVQRYALEIKHTLRMPAGDNACARCSIVGHGADIIGLASTLEKSVGIEVRTGDQDSSRAQSGAMAAPLQLDRATFKQLAMRPESVQWSNRKSTVYRALAAGTAAAGLLLAAEAVVVSASTSGDRERITELRPQIRAISSHDNSVQTINAVSEEVADALSWTHDELGVRPIWSSVLGDLTTVFDGNTELIELRASDRSGSPAIMLHWYEFTGEDDSSTATEVSVLDQIPKIPAVAEVVLQSRRKLIINGQQAMEYRVRADLHVINNRALLARMIDTVDAESDVDPANSQPVSESGERP
jgi:Tfp pilus assembly PilM family ATPase